MCVGSITVIPNLFNRWKGVAFGLLNSGVALGNLAFPFIIKILEETYGWRGSFLMMSGMALHICFCGSLLSPASMTPVQTDLNAGSHQVNKFNSDPPSIQTDSSSDGKIPKTDTENFEVVKMSDDKSFQTNNKSIAKNLQKDRTSDTRSFQKNCKVKAKNFQMDKMPGAQNLQIDNTSEIKNFPESCTVEAKSLQVDQKSGAKHLQIGNMSNKKGFQKCGKVEAKSSQTDKTSGAKNLQIESMSENTSFQRNCEVEAKSLQMDKTSSGRSFQNTCKTNIESLRLDLAEDAESYGKECTLDAKRNQIIHRSTATNFELDWVLTASSYHLMNWETKLKSFFHFLSPSILILTCSNFLYLVGCSVFTNHMPAFTLRELGLDFSERSWLVTSIGISALLASWIQGVLLDIPSLDCQVLYMVCYFSMGIAVGCVPFVTSYAGMLILCIFFGFMYAANGPALAKITLLYTGSANFVSGYGCVNLGGGVGIVLGGPMAGGYALA